MIGAAIGLSRVQSSLTPLVMTPLNNKYSFRHFIPYSSPSLTT